ncbi:Gag-Pro-Pol polyprotein [Frankliniella fusca]|uniref:Gag-Pro-Pol polyprotein n=1 Tax=Frankliniella fusca TaxID=407009 RepID=A0AAE1LGU6_9NEOP|nr:Gag-Pro-Pol polyprotein [Frankliniella fusca]
MSGHDGNVARPGPVNLKSGNIQANWLTFKQQFNFYLVAIGKKEADKEVKCALLMGEAGKGVLEVYSSFKGKLVTSTTDPATNVVTQVDKSLDYDLVMAEFDAHAAERKCVIGCRERFNARNQRVNEPFATWLTDLSKPDPVVLIWGTHDKKRREMLRARASASLQEIIDMHKAAEATSRDDKTQLEVDVDSCRRYGGNNHWSINCTRSPRKNNNHKTDLKEIKKRVDNIHLEDDDNDGFEFLQRGFEIKVSLFDVLTIENKAVIVRGEHKNPRREYTEVLRLANDRYVKFKLDPGSEVNILPYKVFKIINRNYRVMQSNIVLKSYGKSLTKPIGAVNLLVETQHGTKSNCEFQISTADPRPLQGIEACEMLDLVKRVVHTQAVNAVEALPLLYNCQAETKVG